MAGRPTVLPVGTAEDIEAQLRADLKQAMRARDQAAVRALRTGLAAIANAEAPAAVEQGWRSPVVGELVEHERLVLTAEDVRAILRAQVAERRTAIDEYRQLGRDSEAAELAAEVAALEPHLA
jgi:uncharacterized protein